GGRSACGRRGRLRRPHGEADRVREAAEAPGGQAHEIELSPVGHRSESTLAARTLSAERTGMKSSALVAVERVSASRGVDGIGPGRIANSLPTEGTEEARGGGARGGGARQGESRGRRGSSASARAARATWV